MKKLLFSVIALVLITSSCNKYKDDFKNINARLDALSAQVAGVAGLQTGIAALQTQLTSLASAVAAIPNNTAAITSLQTGLTNLTTTVTGIQTALGNLATAVSTGNTTTQGLISTLTTQVTANQTALTALTAAVAALQTSANANTTTLTAIQTTLAGIVTTQTAQTTALGNISTQAAAIKAVVDALTTNLAIANLNIQILLANSQFYEGVLNIFDEATLAFAETLLNRIALIKGPVTINTTALSAGQKTRLDVVAGKMISVIGTFTFTGAGTTFGQLASVSSDVTFTATGNVNVPALSSVGGNYTVTGSDINDAGLKNVNGNLSLDYDGGYSSSSLMTVGGTVSLNNYTTGGSVVGTTTVSFPALTSAGTVNGGTPSFGSATSVDLGAGALTSLTATKATSVRLGQAVYSGTLIVIASSTAASAINLSALDSTTGFLSVTGFTGSTVDLSNYRNGANGSLTVSPGFASLNLPKYSYGSIIGAGVKTLTAPMYRLSTTKAGAIADLTGLPIIETVVIGNAEWSLDNLFGAAIPNTLKSLDYTGNGGNSWVILSGLTNVATVKIGGTISLNGPVAANGGAMGVDLENLPALTSVTTSGVINALVLFNNSNAGLTSVTLNHTHKVGGPGSYLWVQGCNKLTSLTTSTDFAESLWIRNNTSLATINLASYVNTVLGGTIDVQIFGNKTSGTYTATVVGTATTARVDPKYTASSPYMSQMKTYLSKFTGVPFAPATPTTAATATFKIGIDDVDPTAGVQTLDAAMTADGGLSACDAFNTTCYAANVASSHVNTPTELIKFQ